MVTRVTNKIDPPNHRFEMKKISKSLLKEKIKHIKFNQFFNYCTHNKNEIEGSHRKQIELGETEI